MSYEPHAKFWLINKGKKACSKSGACFAQLRYLQMPEAVRYVAEIQPEIHGGIPFDQAAVTFFLDFTKRVLVRPECPKFSFRKMKDKVFFKLDTSKLTFIQALFYLTWFRYVQEFPDILTELYKRKVDGDPDDIVFHKLQEVHDEAIAGKIKLMYNNLSGHGLIHRYNGYGDESPAKITIDRLVENIKAKPSSVQAYFT